MAAKAGRSVYVAIHLHDSFHAVEIARRCLELSNRIDRALPRRLVALILGDLLTASAGVSHLTIPPRQLAGGEDKIAGTHPRLVRRHSRRRRRQLDAQFG